MPMMAAVIDVDKISHCAAIEDSIVHIAAHTGSKKTQRDMNQSLPVSAEKKDREYRCHRDNRDCRQEIGFTCEPAESGAVVERLHQL
jgi:hypothetical protein